MELKEYFEIIYKKFWIIIIILIFAIATSGAVSIYLLPKVYEASTTLILRDKKADTQTGSVQYDEILSNQKLVKTYSIIAKSNYVLNEVIRTLDLNMPVKELRSDVEVTSESETEVIRITTQSTDPQQAMNIANTLADVFKSRVQEILRLDNVNTIDMAELPLEPSKPRPILNIAAAGMASFMLGICIIFLLNYLDNTIKSEEEIEKYAHIPVLGLIPKFTKKSKSFLIRTVLESYKIVRTNMQFTSIDKPLRTIVVTSPLSSEGKTTTAANLAISLAQSDKRILLIDCDLRKSSVHKVFNLPNLEGLTTILPRENYQYRDIKRSIPDIKNLDVITCGSKPANPAELLGSSRMKHFLNMVLEQYDMIVLDAPPLLLVADALLLSSMADGVLLVTSYGRSAVDAVKKASGSLKKANARIIGAIINNSPEKSHYAYDYYYQENSKAKEAFQ